MADGAKVIERVQIGERVMLICATWIYEGVLLARTHDTVVLGEAEIVYETGWGGGTRQTDPMPVRVWEIGRSAVEGCGALLDQAPKRGRRG